MSVDSPTNNLKDRIDHIRERIRAAAERSGRAADAVRLVAATKTVDVATIVAASLNGIREIGENRVQEASAKSAALEDVPGLRTHFIGQLQTNKARRAVELFELIQSVDRPRLAESLDRAARELGKRQRCLIEVKISDDDAKGGLSPGDLDAFVGEFSEYRSLQLDGLMGIAPFDGGEAAARAAFRKLSALFERHRDKFGDDAVLSMGMSEDFEAAIEEGSTMVRIGRAIFGERPRLR